MKDQIQTTQKCVKAWDINGFIYLLTDGGELWQRDWDKTKKQCKWIKVWPARPDQMVQND